MRGRLKNRGLNFKRIRIEVTKAFIKPFSEEEVLLALNDCQQDKTMGENLDSKKSNKKILVFHEKR